MGFINYTGTYTDQYQLAMGQVYFLQGQKDQPAVFDYFFRKLPFEGGYAIFAGLHDLLPVLEELRFDQEDLEFLRSRGLHPAFLQYLKNFRFGGAIYSSREGDVIFPTRPILRVEGTILETQLMETLLLNVLNFQSLIATKASRMRLVAPNRLLMEFGLRRSQGTGGYQASRAAVIGGFDATSHVRAARDYGMPPSGTMAHAFIQSYDDELTAFRRFAEVRPDDCTLLVDTYNTLRSGVPHAIAVAKEMESRGHRLKGIRLDSGDLAFLAKRSRQMLDEAGLPYVQIVASNQLDEYVIKSLLEQEAPIDGFGVGTSLVTGQPDAALDGVFKLCLSGNKPRIKLSENPGKVTLPFRKQVYRVFDEEGNFYGADAVVLEEEKDVDLIHHPQEKGKSLSLLPFRKEPLLTKVMENGEQIGETPTLASLAGYTKERLALLPDEFKRFQYPHLYKIGISTRVKEERDKLIEQYKVK
ncbi:nicotinate phosphoribosyltransferase [soil metagenome]